MPLGELRLRLTFSDGLVRELDFEPTLKGAGLDALRDPTVFGQVEIDQVAGTIVWPDGADLDPDVLHGDHKPASVQAPTLLRQYRLQRTG
ncbi:MAG: DUF2442 domain-containing protein [Acidimicrobiales bacterium]